MFTSLAMIVALLIGLWMVLIVVVPMREEVVIERFGRYLKTLKPGFYVLIPLIDQVAYRQEIREQVLDVATQSCITADNVQVEMDGLVYLKVIDSYKASYGIEDYRSAAVNLAQTTMRSEIGKISLDNTFSERDNINERIVNEIDKASEPWGIKVLRYEIKNISPSDNVIHTLEKEMEAVRQKRAEITLSGAQKIARVNISEGDKQEAINLSSGERQKRMNEAEGRSQAIKLLAEATAQGTTRIAAAIKRPGGREAVQYQLLEQYLETFGEIVSSAKISVLPADIAYLKGVLKALSFNLKTDV